MEREVFTIGVWKNYDELEECLTLNELIETSNALAEQHGRMIRAFGGVMGVPTGPDPKQRLQDKIDQMKSKSNPASGIPGMGYVKE